jgi:hypothetical protein
MQDFIRAEGEKLSRLPNPFLDFAIVGLEAQLKAWQAYQVEGTRFVAKRMRADLEHLRALGHCCDVQSMGTCQLAWLRDMQKDYAEEGARLAATNFGIGFADISGLGWLFGQRTVKTSPQSQPERQTGTQTKPKGFQAAA